MAWDNATVFGGYERGVACADTLTVFGGDLVGGAGLHALALADAEDVAGGAFFYTFVVFPIPVDFISTFVKLFAGRAGLFIFIICWSQFWTLLDTVS